MRKVYVDTNVLVDYCLVRDNKYKPNYLFAYEFFRRGISCEFHIVISDWAQEEALKYVNKKDINELLVFISSKLISLKCSEEQKKEAFRISSNWPDARHAIMARDSGCEVVATNDADFGAFLHIVGSAHPQSI